MLAKQEAATPLELTDEVRALEIATYKVRALADRLGACEAETKRLIEIRLIEALQAQQFHIHRLENRLALMANDPDPDIDQGKCSIRRRKGYTLKPI